MNGTALDKSDKSRSTFQIRALKIAAGTTLIVAVLVSGIFAPNIRINSNNKVEFGQGIQNVVACDKNIGFSVTSKMNLSTGEYFIDSLTLSDLSVQLHDRTLKISFIATDGSVLGTPFTFSVGSNGLTYTSTRLHTDDLDAFSPGGGSLQEMGSSSIKFYNLLNEESPQIPASLFSRINLESSGYGECSVPQNTGAVKVYIDAPNVQGSYISESYTASSLTDTFNSVTVDNSNCPTSGQTGTYSYTGSDCLVLLGTHNSNYIYGGALTTSSTATTTGTKSPSAGVYTSAGTTITFNSRKNYIGFWWSAGSTGNSVKFYRGSTLVSTITGDDVYNLIPKNSATLTAIDSSTTYTKSNYYGHPKNQANEDAGEPFVYIHAFAINGFNFDKILITTTGNGFEFDNLTVANLSTSQLDPKKTLVFVKGYTYTG